MKKSLGIFLVAFITFALFACGEEERVYAYDGDFMAYEVSVTRNAPQVISVTVTIENDAITKYTIDTRQGNRTGDGTEDVPYVWAWNTQTKKELGDAYGMAGASDIGKEWDEQAEAIEAFWLENGVDAITVDGDGNIDNVTGATISDSYSAIAQQAVQHAVEGKFVAIYESGTDIYSAEMTLSDGEIDTLILDVLQAETSQADGSFVWNAASKQELGDDYGMKGVGGGYTFTDGAWVSSGSQATLEWYEQVNLISNYIISNGYNENLQAVESRGGSLDGSTLVDALAGATIRTGSYYTLLAKLFETNGVA